MLYFLSKSFLSYLIALSWTFHSLDRAGFGHNSFLASPFYVSEFPTSSIPGIGEVKEGPQGPSLAYILFFSFQCLCISVLYLMSKIFSCI